MIKIKINKKRFKGIYRWDEMSLQRFCDLASIPMPEGYEAYILADGKFNHEDKASMDYYSDVVLKLTDKQLKEDFPDYFRKVIAWLSDAPIELLNNIPSDEIEHEYNKYFRPFVLSLLYNAPVINFMGQVTSYVPEQIKSFRIGLHTFRLPETVHILDQDIPLANEPIITYSEASDIFRGMKVGKEDVKRLSLFMAIYCRKRWRKYNEQTALKRQNLMMKAPMSVVWAVFFYTVRRLPESSMTIRLFGRLPKQIHEARDQALIYRDLAAVV